MGYRKKFTQNANFKKKRKEGLFMLNGIQIIRIGIAVTVIALVITHTVDATPHDEVTSFFMGMGCSLSIVGAGKRFFEFVRGGQA